VAENEEGIEAFEMFKLDGDLASDCLSVEGEYEE
jgi:hypothetical protein